MNLFHWQLTSISFPWSWLNTIPWSCINIQLLGVKWCLECKYILLNVNMCISWILHHLQTANHNQLWVVTQTNTNNDLLVLWVLCEQRLLYPHEKQRPLVSPRKPETSCIPTKTRDLLYTHEKQRPLVSPRKMFMVPHDKSATKNLRSRLLSVRTSRKTDFRKLKITLVASTYPGQRPQCPSLSPSCSLDYWHTERTVLRRTGDGVKRPDTKWLYGLNNKTSRILTCHGRCGHIEP